MLLVALRYGNMRPSAILSARASLAALLAVTTPLSAGAAQEWIGSSRQWSIGYVNDGGDPYCTLLWDSMAGKTVEFRESLKDASWIIKNDAWTLPEHLTTQISVKGKENTVDVPAIGADSKSLRVWSLPGNSNAGGVQAIIRAALAGMADIDVSFQGNEPDWVIPTSRIYPMHATYTACIQRLSDRRAAKVESATTNPF
jgi:hypothetical protein